MFLVREGGGGGGTGIQNKKKIRAHNFSYHHNVLAKIFSNVARVSLSAVSLVSIYVKQLAAADVHDIFV